MNKLQMRVPSRLSFFAKRIDRNAKLVFTIFTKVYMDNTDEEGTQFITDTQTGIR